MSLKTLILRSFVGPLVCTLLACSLLNQAANAAVVEAKAENNFLGWKFTARPETTVQGKLRSRVFKIMMAALRRSILRSQV